MLLVLILGLSYTVLYLIYRNRKQEKILNRPQEFYGDSLEIIESAQKQANSIVEKAVESAKHILFETEYVKQDITREMQDSLTKVAEESVKLVQGRSVESEKAFREVVDEIKAEFAKEAEKRLTAIEKIVDSEANDFKAMLLSQTIGSQEFIGKKIGEDFQDLQGQLSEYKKSKLSEIDKNINSVIKDVVKETLGASITIPIHEDLVLSSLENAKKGGLFKSLEEDYSKIETDPNGIVPPVPSIPEGQVNENNPTPLLEDEGLDPEEPVK